MKLGYALMTVLVLGCSEYAPKKAPTKPDSGEVKPKPKPKGHDDDAKKPHKEKH